MVGGAGMRSHGVMFNFDSAKVCSPAIMETYLSYDKNIGMAVTDYYMYFYLCYFYWKLSSINNFTAS